MQQVRNMNRKSLMSRIDLDVVNVTFFVTNQSRHLILLFDFVTVTCVHVTVVTTACHTHSHETHNCSQSLVTHSHTQSQLHISLGP